MKRILKNLLTVVISIIVFGSCSTYKSTIYKEVTIKPNDIEYTKIAILPNRLPVNLKNPEYWRKYNWELIKANFEQKGVQVLDYNTSVRLFEESGLPVEDTKISRDKYAELAEVMGVDVLIFPYYGTNYYLQSGFFFNTNHYLSIGTLQFYSVKHNEFFCRLDFEGDTYFKKSGMGTMMAGIGLSIGLSIVDPAFGMIGIALISIPQIFDLIVSMPSPTSRWRTAFYYGIRSGINSFTQTYTPNRGGYKNLDSKNITVVGHNVTKGEYSKYSIEQLKKMKKEALQQEDYIKANDINKEIENKVKNGTQSNTSSSKYDKFSIKELEAMKKEALATEDFKKAGEIKKVIDTKKVKLENSKYGKYSIDELKTMKEEAVKNGDYKKAGEIKKEIENR